MHAETASTNDRWNEYSLILWTLILCTVLGLIIPSGRFEQIQSESMGAIQTVIAPGSYHRVEKNFNPLSLLTAVPTGMIQMADLLTMLICLGGVYGIFRRTGLIDGLLGTLIARIGTKPYLFSLILFSVLAMGSSLFGISDEIVILTPVFIKLGRQLGFNTLYSIALILIPVTVGYAAGTTNPFNVVIAHKLAEIPVTQGLLLRVAFFLSAMALCFGYLIRYGMQTRTEVGSDTEVPLESGSWRHFVAAALVLATYFFIFFGILSYDWTFIEMTGGFLSMGIITSLFFRLSQKEATEAFIEGVGQIIPAIILISFARGIQVVMEKAEILDTVIYQTTALLEALPPVIALQGLFIFQSILGVFIPSGTGHAMLTLPLTVPVTDLLQISRECCVIAFQLGDGLPSIALPTNSDLLVVLNMAGISFGKWFRFIFPLFIGLTVLAMIFLMVSLHIGYL